MAISLCELGDEMLSSFNVEIIDLSVSENDSSASMIKNILSFSLKDSMHFKCSKGLF